MDWANHISRSRITSLFVLLILSASLVSCGVSKDGSRSRSLHATNTISFSPTPTKTPLPKNILTPTVTPTQVNNLVCSQPSSVDSLDGWDCTDEIYGFTVHFPSSALLGRVMENVVEISLENSSSNHRIDRMISIASATTAESCFSSDDEKVKIGEYNFAVENGFEPSGVVYAWKSYAVTKESKTVCFFFHAGYMMWDKDDPLFPSEQDQGLDDVEAILKTFRWLKP